MLQLFGSKGSIVHVSFLTTDLGSTVSRRESFKGDFKRFCRAESHRTPIIEALQQHAARETVPLHIPGHKQGSSLSPDFLGILQPDTAKFDLTELPGSNLHVWYGDLSGMICACI